MGAAEWQSVVVAIALLGLIGVITVSAIRKYHTVDEALKVVAALSGLLGVVTGASATYFFTRQPLIEAREQNAAYRAQLLKIESSLVPELTKLQANIVAVKSAADGAQSTANQALAAAQAAQSSEDAENEKIDRMFKRSM
jgi:hypothetical protein